jgi:hypothetical protein
MAGAPDGASVARVAWASGTAFSLSDEQGGAKPTVAATAAGTTYVASAYVKAATSSSIGKTVQILLRERTSSGAVVRETSAAAKLTGSFARIAVSAPAAAAGDTLGVRLVQSSAAAGDAFAADLVSVRRASTVLGSAQAGGVWTAASKDSKRVSAFTLAGSTAVDLASLSAYLDGRAGTTGSQPVRAVVYADAGGAPGALVARSADVTIAAGRAAGWVSLPLAAPARLAPGTYWLGLQSGGTTAVARYAAAPAAGALRYGADAFADGPAAAFGAASTDAKALSMFAVGA